MSRRNVFCLLKSFPYGVERADVACCSGVVKAGLRNARAKGKRLGRPRTFVSEFTVTALRDSGVSWRAIAERLGLAWGPLTAPHSGAVRHAHKGGCSVAHWEQQRGVSPCSLQRKAK